MLDKLRVFCESQGGLIAMMALLLFLFSILALYTTAVFPANEKAFLLFSNLVTGISSALFTLARVAGRLEREQRDSEEKQNLEIRQ